MPKCTYCGGTEWFEGPSGGMSTNILCANNDCRHWFNYSPGLMFDDLKRIEPTTEERRTAVEDRERKEETDYQKRIEEGRQAYRNGIIIGPVTGDYNKSSIRGNPAYGGYAEPSKNIDRIVGYMEALADDVRRMVKHFDLIKSRFSDQLEWGE